MTEHGYGVQDEQLAAASSLPRCSGSVHVHSIWNKPVQHPVPVHSYALSQAQECAMHADSEDGLVHSLCVHVCL